jgi:hypothetical protein
MKYFTLGKPQDYVGDVYAGAGNETLLMGVFYKNLDNIAPITDTPVEAVAAYAGDVDTDPDDLGDSASNTAFVTDDSDQLTGQAVPQLFGLVRDDGSLLGGTYSAAYSVLEGAIDSGTAKTGFFIGVTGDHRGKPYPFGDVHVWTTTGGWSSRQTLSASDFSGAAFPTGINTANGFDMTYYSVADAVAESTELTNFEEDVSTSSDATGKNLIHILIEGYEVAEGKLTRSMTNPV